MEIRRTANAGVLLKLDGVSILLDGVCREVTPYLATPPEERKHLSEHLPDVLAFTHFHMDHYDPDFAAFYRKQGSGVILGPGEIPHCTVLREMHKIRGVTVTPVQSRHIGKAGATTAHVSFIIQGSQCVWFLGDASPLQWKGRMDLPRPDVLIVPFAYAATSSAWQLTRTLGAHTVVLVHMPPVDDDPAGIWQAVNGVLAQCPSDSLRIPELGESICICRDESH